jgi:hypothetical protein
MLVVVACWGGGAQEPREGSGGPGPVGPNGIDKLSLAKVDVSSPPRAALDGVLQVQPEPFCGGARVPPNYVPPPLAPAPGIKLRVLAGNKYSDAAPVMELTTGPGGVFTADLPAGRYCIARAHGAKPSGSTAQYTDAACLLARWEACEAIAEVPVKAKLAIDIHEPCSWSICYFGAPPP